MLSATLLTILCLVWGSTWIVIAGGLEHLPPFQAAAARFLLAAAVMSLVARIWGVKEGGTRAPLRLVLAVGTLNFAASYGIVYWCETRMPSALASVLWSVYPLLMACSTQFFLVHERLQPRQWLGFVTSFLGIVLLFAKDLRAISPEALQAGTVLMLSPLVVTVGTTLVKRAGPGVSSLYLNRDALWVGAGWLTLIAILFEREAPAQWTPPAIASVAYLGIAGTALTFGIYFWLLRHTTAYRMSLVSYVTPPIAVLLGWWIGDEPISVWTLLAMGLIFSGVALATWVRRS
jgi:drug/metabolite transporter (DMT)-like permease